MEEVTQKSFLKSKTFWIAAFTVISAFLAQFAGIDITSGLDGTTVQMILGIVFMILRFTTGVSIGIADLPAQEYSPIAPADGSK
jgi:uncharacterized membrane protein